MNIKTKLEDENLFAKKTQGKADIDSLNKKGVYTIEDFINCDIEQTFSGINARNKYRAFQKILRYKYLGEPLVLDIILDKEYSNVNSLYPDFNRDIVKLGYVGYSSFTVDAELIIKEEGSLKMIDFISRLGEKFEYLSEFYIEYYNTQMRKENIEEVSVENDKTTLNELKNQLVSLMNRRNELDLQISSLLEQINTLEGGKVANGRK